MGLKSLGTARIFKDTRTGELVVDKTSLRRGGDRLDGDDELDDFGDEDLGDEDELGDDDELGEDEDFGDASARRSRRKRRKARREGRQEERQDERDGRRDRRRGEEDNAVTWAKTALAGESNTPASSGDPITITIRPQHWFKAMDITFSGDSSAKIDSIFFGEKPVWNNSTGVPVSVFSSTGMLRGLLAGQKIRPGLDIVIKGTAGSTSATTATLIGYKPINQDC